MKILSKLDDASFHVKFNLAMIVIWTCLLIPTMLLWRESVPWIVAMSWYANWVGHISAWVSSKAEVKIDESDSIGDESSG